MESRINSRRKPSPMSKHLTLGSFQKTKPVMVFRNIKKIYTVCFTGSRLRAIYMVITVAVGSRVMQWRGIRIAFFGRFLVAFLDVAIVCFISAATFDNPWSTSADIRGIRNNILYAGAAKTPRQRPRFALYSPTSSSGCSDSRRELQFDKFCDQLDTRRASNDYPAGKCRAFVASEAEIPQVRQ